MAATQDCHCCSSPAVCCDETLTPLCLVHLVIRLMQADSRTTSKEVAEVTAIVYGHSRDTEAVLRAGLEGYRIGLVEIPGEEAEEPTPPIPGPPSHIITYRCCSPRCPGYSYPASQMAHPVETCGPLARPEVAP